MIANQYHFKELDSDSKCLDLLIQYQFLNDSSDNGFSESETALRVVFSNSSLDSWKNDKYKKQSFGQMVALDITRQILEWQLKLYQSSKIMITDILSICYLDNSDLPNSDLVLETLPF